MLDLERKQDITGDIVFLLQVLPSRYECDAPRPAVDITVVTSYILSCWSKPWLSNGFILEKNWS